MRYIKRSSMGNFWPVPRKGTKYVACSLHNKKNSIPLVVVMRDILGIVKNKKELSKILNEKKVLINCKEIRETNYPVSLFDIISIPVMKKNFRAVLNENKKMSFEDVSDKEAESKVFKIIGKKLLKGGKIQYNLMQGMNIISKEKANVDDSLLFNFKEGKLERIFQFKKGNSAFVIKGKHIGKSGKIEDVLERGGKKLIKIDTKKERINVWIKSVLIME